MSHDTPRAVEHDRPIVTLQSHILQEQVKIRGSTGTLSWILSALSVPAKMISSKVRRARVPSVLGEAGSGIVQGERRQEPDVISNNVRLRLLKGREGVAIVASEENEEPLIVRSDLSGERQGARWRGPAYSRCAAKEYPRAHAGHARQPRRIR